MIVLEMKCPTLHSPCCHYHVTYLHQLQCFTVIHKDCQVLTLSCAIPHLKRTIPPGEDFNWISLNKQPWNQLFVFYLPFFGWQ